MRHIDVDDIVIYLLKKAHSHLDYNTTVVRITVFGFSSTLSTIRPLLLWVKMGRMQIETSMITWVTDTVSQIPVCASGNLAI